MFNQQKEILGISVLVNDDKTLVLTYWKDKKDIHAMENDLLYNQTVNKIRDAGFLTDPQLVEIFEAPVEIIDLKSK